MMDNQESLKELVSQGLSAMKAGANVAEKATAEIMNDASNVQLKQALEQGNDQSQTWNQRIDRALQEVGAQADKQNLILQAHYDVSKKIRANAQDDFARDLGIIASGQMALHYWIASFGTVRAYAEQVGLDQTAQEMAQCLDEAKEADQHHNEIAASLMSGQPMQSREQTTSAQLQ